MARTLEVVYDEAKDQYRLSIRSPTSEDVGVDQLPDVLERMLDAAKAHPGQPITALDLDVAEPVSSPGESEDDAAGSVTSGTAEGTVVDTATSDGDAA